MNAAKSTFRARYLRTVRKVFLNAFAIMLTVLPLVSMTLWVGAIAQGDGRSAASLKKVEPTQPRPFSEGLVSITFDDGWQSTYKNGVPVLQEHGYPATFYVLSGVGDEAEYMSSKQIVSLYGAGYEIGSHGIDHKDLATLNAGEVRDQMASSKKFLQELGVADDTVSFASPFSSYTPESLRLTLDAYYVHRNTEADLARVGPEDVNSQTSLRQRDIMAYSVRVSTPDDQLRQALAYAKQQKAWFVLVYHQIDDSRLEFSVSKETFARHMQIVKESGVKVASVGDIVGEIDWSRQ